ncbi:phage portal protein [Minwuia thermotolerans]|uniref:Phage portal protein n=1 Tax=Minwuia thermotolerans TaxID=2056226 RepID=A0A2M9G2J3_9PROT|nr:phage portal protein [Minwuia thermotolerans]PJK29947.1 phage portal protein [Minwuia thermotolerans]
MSVARTRARLKSLKPAGVRAMQANFARPYDASSRSGRLQGWMASASGPNAVARASVHEMRRKTRQMVRNNPWAASAILTQASECIGSGVKPMSKSPDRNFQNAAQELWADWTPEADADGRLDLYGLQALAAREMYEAGEIFVRRVDRDPASGLLLPLQYQLIEAEQVPVELDRLEPNGNVIRQGVEFDPSGRRVAYHVWREHPNDASIEAHAGEIVRVPADEMIHLFKPLRAGQIRGLPNLAPVLLKAFDLDGYEDAELVRKKMAAMFAAFITTPDPEDRSPLETATDTADAAGSVATEISPGTMVYLEPGDEVNFSSPADVGGAYGEFLTWQLRAFAAGAGLSYDQVTGDLTKVNYSSIRAGTLKLRRRMRMDQQQIIAHQLCRPIWRDVIDTGVMAGELQVRDFIGNRRAHLRVQWMAEGWEWVDPQKEQAAEQSAVRNGFTSRQAVVAKLGRDVDVVDQEIRSDNDRADRLGLVLDTDPRRVSRAGLTQARPEGSEIPQDEADRREDDEAAR